MTFIGIASAARSYAGLGVPHVQTGTAFPCSYEARFEPSMSIQGADTIAAKSSLKVLVALSTDRLSDHPETSISGFSSKSLSAIHLR